MTDSSKIQATHTQRAAFVYLRQSTPSQVERNRESTARQYALADCNAPGYSAQFFQIRSGEYGEDCETSPVRCVNRGRGWRRLLAGRLSIPAPVAS